MTNQSSTTKWKHAVWHVVLDKLTANIPFTSGEIVRELRIKNTDLHFSVKEVGRYLEELFQNRQFVFSPRNAIKIERTTDGSTRTPAGTTVNIYAPSYDEAMRHSFEVEVPAPTTITTKTITFTNDSEIDLEEEDDLGDDDEEEKIFASLNSDLRLTIPSSVMKKVKEHKEYSLLINLQDKKVKLSYTTVLPPPYAPPYKWRFAQNIKPNADGRIRLFNDTVASFVPNNQQLPTKYPAVINDDGYLEIDFS